jgi:hypothetical protein
LLASVSTISPATSRRQDAPCRRRGEADDQGAVFGEDLDRLGAAGPEYRDAAILAGCREAIVRQRSDRVDRRVVKADHRAGRAGLDIPDDRRPIKAAGNRQPAVGRDREGSDRRGRAIARSLH